MNVNDEFRIKWANGRIETKLIAEELTDCGRIDTRGYAKFDTIVEKFVIDADMPFDVIWSVFFFVHDFHAEELVNNAKFDPTITNDFGETVLGVVIGTYHREAAEMMMKSPDFQPNLLSVSSSGRDVAVPPDDEEPWVHYVLHAAGGVQKYYYKASSRQMRRLVRAVLAHEKTDIRYDF